MQTTPPPLLISNPHPLHQSLHERLSTRRVTAITVRNHLIILGCNDGSLIMLLKDTSLTTTSNDKVSTNKFQNHIRELVSAGKSEITSIDLDFQSNFIAWATADGLVTVKNVHDLDEKHTAKFIHGIRHVVLAPKCEPDFPIITDSPSGQLSLTRRSWFVSRTKDIYKCEKPISSISWRNDLVVFCSFDGSCTVLDFNPGTSSTSINSMNKPLDIPRLRWSIRDLKSSSITNTMSMLSWENDETLLVTYGNELLVIKCSATDIEIILRLSFDTSLFGSVSFGTRDGKILICFMDQGEGLALIERKTPLNIVAQLKLPTSSPTEQYDRIRFVCCDDSSRLNDKSSTPIDDDSQQQHQHQQPSNLPIMYLITGLNHLMIIRSRTTDDVIQNLMLEGEFNKALQVSKRALNMGFKLDVINMPKEIESYWLDYSANHQDWASAADLLTRVLPEDNAIQWSKWVTTFYHHHKLFLIALKIPTHIPIVIHDCDDSLYDAVLSEILFLDDDHEMIPSTHGELYLLVLKRWVKDIGITKLQDSVDVEKHISTLVKLTSSNVGSSSSSRNVSPSLSTPSPRPATTTSITTTTTTNSSWWLISLAWWYAVMNKMQEAFWTMFEITTTSSYGEEIFELFDVFPVLKNELVHATDKLGILCDLNEGKTISLLWSLIIVDNQLGIVFVEHLFSSRVNRPIAGLQLLRKLLTIVDGLGDLYVERCAEYDSTRLFEFLMDGGSKYSITKAEQVCKKFNLLRERVFLLRRVGGTKEALLILLKQLRDVDTCLALAQKDGYDSWNEIVEYCGTDGKLLDELLARCLNYGLDPSRVILGVRHGLILSTWKIRLVEIFHTLTTQRRAAEIICKYSRREASESVRIRYKQLKKGVKISTESFCGICGFDLMMIGNNNINNFKGDIVVFRGRGETYHSKCLMDAGRIVSRGATPIAVGLSGSSSSSLGDGSVITMSSMSNNSTNIINNNNGSEQQQTTLFGEEDVSKRQALAFWGEYSSRVG
jgi:hypothetical protein